MIRLYSSPQGTYNVAQSNRNIVKEYKAKADESNTTNPYPLHHPPSYTLRIMLKAKLLLCLILRCSKSGQANVIISYREITLWSFKTNTSTYSTHGQE